jgi:hypothetical protein
MFEVDGIISLASHMHLLVVRCDYLNHPYRQIKLSKYSSLPVMYIV